MKLEETFVDFETDYYVDLAFQHSKHRISVYKPTTRYGGEPIASQINWPAIGSVSVEETNKFIKGLQDAVAVATALNNTLKGGDWRHIFDNNM